MQKKPFTITESFLVAIVAIIFFCPWVASRSGLNIAIEQVRSAGLSFSSEMIRIVRFFGTSVPAFVIMMIGLLLYRNSSKKHKTVEVFMSIVQTVVALIVTLYTFMTVGTYSAFGNAIAWGGWLTLGVLLIIIVVSIIEVINTIREKPA